MDKQEITLLRRQLRKVFGDKPEVMKCFDLMDSRERKYLRAVRRRSNRLSRRLMKERNLVRELTGAAAADRSAADVQTADPVIREFYKRLARIQSVRLYCDWFCSCCEEITGGIMKDEQKAVRVAGLIYDYCVRNKWGTGEQFLARSAEIVGVKSSVRSDITQKADITFGSVFDRDIRKAVSSCPQLFSGICSPCTADTEGEDTNV